MQSFFRGEKLCKFIGKNSVLLRHSLNPNGLIWCLNMAISFVNMLNIVSSAYIHDFVLNACDTFDDKFIFWLSYVILMNIYKLICHLTSLNLATIYLYNFLVVINKFHISTILFISPNNMLECNFYYTKIKGFVLNVILSMKFICYLISLNLATIYLYNFSVIVNKFHIFTILSIFTVCSWSCSTHIDNKSFTYSKAGPWKGSN